MHTIYNVIASLPEWQPHTFLPKSQCESPYAPLKFFLVKHCSGAVVPQFKYHFAARIPHALISGGVPHQRHPDNEFAYTQ